MPDWYIQWFRDYLAGGFPSYRRAVAAAAHDPSWVCWQYTEAEWERWNRIVWQDQHKRLYRVLVGEGVGALILVAISTLAIDEYRSLGVLPYLFVLLTVFGTSYLVYRSVHPMYQRMVDAGRARQTGPREICIGPDRVTMPGQLVLLAGYTVDESTTYWDPIAGGIDVLQTAEIREANPAWLIFQGRRVHSKGGLGWRIFIKVPIPIGCEAQAADVMRKFQDTILSSD